MKPIIQLRLFVCGQDLAALRAIESLKAVCDDRTVRCRYRIDLEIIDIHESPELADEEQVFATPTLLKMQPPPARRLVGDLSSRKDILSIMDMESPSGTESGAGEGNA
ncbi:MAG TPA: circadian clock KaiB family protein [Arenicellales bacterium]|nr:circadian clock KaiB family protein [Arenicellales bacterium]